MLEMLPSIETDRSWISITQITPASADRHTQRTRVCLPVFLSLCVYDLRGFSERHYQRDFRYQKIHLPLRGRRNSVAGLGGGVPEESARPPAMFTLLRERASVLAGTAFSNPHTFHPALQIYDHTRASPLRLHCRTASKEMHAQT